MANNWAIVIGINNYQHHPERRLKYAVNDAQRIDNFLSKQSGFGEAHILRCLGNEVHQGSSTYPTCSNLLRLLRRELHPDRLGNVNHLWFYFSGHGVSRNGRDYLITADCLEDEIERFALPIDEVIASLRVHKDADIVLVLDACRQLLGRKDFDSSIGEQTIVAAKERGITTIFSCDYGQYSYELDALQQGAFTYALVEGLSQHTLPIQLETYLQQRVPELHRQHRHDLVEQTPRIRLESLSQTFQPLLPDAVTASDLEVLVKQATADELKENFETAKKLWWQVIDGSQSSVQRQEARTAVERIDRKIARSEICNQESINFQVKGNENTRLRLLTSYLTTSSFQFEVVTLDQEGYETSRQLGKAQVFIECLDTDVILEMVLVPGGTFRMGSLEITDEQMANESPQHLVTIQPFLMSKFPITQAQWRAVAALPKVNYDLDPDSSNFKGRDRPIECVSWDEAVEFCTRLSVQTGHIYRLPSEAEWEYACRAGTTTSFHLGETIVPTLANYDASYTRDPNTKGTYRRETTPVGAFSIANTFGLYDMHGNVWEWCADYWHGTYNEHPKDGSVWTANGDQKLRVIRGGSWYVFPMSCRSACRMTALQHCKHCTIGFRVVCS
jgi:formylglycine-generating enzyme required for sulfatase activity